jgi:hypothetical protein
MEITNIEKGRLLEQMREAHDNTSVKWRARRI